MAALVFLCRIAATRYSSIEQPSLTRKNPVEVHMHFFFQQPSSLLSLIGWLNSSNSPRRDLANVCLSHLGTIYLVGKYTRDDRKYHVFQYGIMMML